MIWREKTNNMDRGQDVELWFDVQNKKMVLGSRGLKADPPAAGLQAGLLDYTPETQTVTGTFETVRQMHRARMCQTVPVDYADSSVEYPMGDR